MFDFGIGAAVGAVVGEVGDFVKKREARKMFSLQAAADDKRLAKEMQMQNSEGGRKLILAGIDLKKETLKHDTAISANAPSWVHAIRGLVRPGVTIYFCLLLGAVVFISLFTTLSLAPSLEQTVSGIATAAIRWWFGSRK